ncbi:MAG: hypothetical protein HZA91_16425, partial [Verrucomicrobia bacterium]|nr:hypothetical protein [Verrucomicrobiota bacterium]
LKPAIEASGAVVVCDALPTVMADASQLARLFQNLIENAIKFRGPQPLRITVGARRQDKEWRFSVRDNGLGMPLEHRERLFLLFQRLHDRGKYPGSGIGLAVCKKIVERHGGRIWVESTPGQGATFYFTLPGSGGDKL